MAGLRFCMPCLHGTCSFRCGAAAHQAYAAAVSGCGAASGLPCSASSATTSCAAVGRSEMCWDRHASISATAASQHSVSTSTPLQASSPRLLGFVGVEVWVWGSSNHHPMRLPACMDPCIQRTRSYCPEQLAPEWSTSDGHRSCSSAQSAPHFGPNRTLPCHKLPQHHAKRIAVPRLQTQAAANLREPPCTKVTALRLRPAMALMAAVTCAAATSSAHHGCRPGRCCIPAGIGTQQHFWRQVHLQTSRCTL
jgi:hypothetical protein